MPSAPSAREVFFPLDEELQLLPGHLTPSLQESLVRLGTWIPFPRVGQELYFFTHVTASEPTVRRDTQAAGAAYVAIQTEAVEDLERILPVAPAGPAVQLLSVDGAMVPLVHQEWAEVKTLVVGTVNPPVIEKGEAVVHSTDLSYFSRLADAETFGHLALVETHRRGVETAKRVCAVTDGAEWEQGFVDLHRPDAIRILDFYHAAGYVAEAGKAVLGEGTAPQQVWLKDTLHELKHGQPANVLNSLRDMQAETLAGGAVADATLKTLQTSLGYLDKRREQIAYAQFQSLGYPIGSGTVESGNKLVVEARLKGAGMHWARPHVNPMLALRNIACSDRWEEAWPQITQRLRQQARDARVQRHQKRQAKKLSVESAVTPLSRLELPVPSGKSGATEGTLETDLLVLPLSEVFVPLRPSHPGSEAKKPYRPATNHPWRHSPIGRARFKPSSRSGDAKF